MHPADGIVGILGHMQASHFGLPNTRTLLDVPLPPNWSAISAQWAAQHGFHLVREHTETGLLYMCQTGWLAPAVCVSLLENGLDLHVEAWLELDALTQVFTLFATPQQSGLESSLHGADVERANARLAVNRLLDLLGVQTIT